MASCPNCGRITFSDADFCYYCGAKVNMMNNIQLEIPVAENEYAQKYYEYVNTEKKSKSEEKGTGNALTWIILSLLACVIIFAVLFLVIKLARTDYNRNDISSEYSLRQSDIMAFNANGISVFFRCWDEPEDQLISPGVQIFISSKSQKKVILLAKNTEIDGKSISGSLYKEVLPGEETTATVFFPRKELSKYYISSPEEIRMKFDVIDANSGEVLYTSDLFSIKT